jgi:hypothetical protein
MDKYPNIINNFYDNPSEITNKEEIQNILSHYKKEILEDNYILLITSTDIIKKLFIMFLFYYDVLLKESQKDRIHCGIDFEFDTGKDKQIALMQINFSVSNNNFIWIIDPKQYDQDKIIILNDKLLLNDKVYKVLHGSETMDIPYIYKFLLNNDKQKILKFTNKLIDTRFLCEYVRKSLVVNGKCSIYDAFLYFNTIDQTKYDALVKNNESMGPIQYVKWNIYKMNDKLIMYAVNDVLKLNTLAVDIFKKILVDTSTYVRTYYYIIKIIRFIMLERKGVTDIIEFCKDVTSPMNNKIINGIILLEHYNKIMDNCVLKEGDDKIYVNFIESNDYIRNMLKYLLKYVAFYVICKKYGVNINMDVNILYNKLNEIYFNKITNLLKIFENYIMDFYIEL